MSGRAQPTNNLRPRFGTERGTRTPAPISQQPVGEIRGHSVSQLVSVQPHPGNGDTASHHSPHTSRTERPQGAPGIPAQIWAFWSILGDSRQPWALFTRIIE